MEGYCQDQSVNDLIRIITFRKYISVKNRGNQNKAYNSDKSIGGSDGNTAIIVHGEAGGRPWDRHTIIIIVQ